MSIIHLPNTIDDELFTFFANGDLYRYSRTSREALERVQSYINRAFKYRRFLSKFFASAELEAFLELQRRSGMIVCGDALLHFLLRSPHEPNELETIIHLQHIPLLFGWLADSQYRTSLSEEESTDQLHRLRYLHKPPVGEKWCSISEQFGNGPVARVVVNSPNSKKKVIIHVTTSAVIQMIVKTPATCMMNFATHTHIHSLYPRATFDGGISILRPHTATPVPYGNFSQLHREGTVMFIDQCPSFSLFPYGQRSVGDKYTWSLQFEDIGDCDFNRHATNNWLASYTANNMLETHGLTLRSANLEDTYIFSNTIVRRQVERFFDRVRKCYRRGIIRDVDQALHYEITQALQEGYRKPIRLLYE